VETGTGKPRGISREERRKIIAPAVQRLFGPETDSFKGRLKPRVVEKPLPVGTRVAWRSERGLRRAYEGVIEAFWHQGDEACPTHYQVRRGDTYRVRVDTVDGVPIERPRYKYPWAVKVSKVEGTPTLG
jgi:hypothetical protein